MNKIKKHTPYNSSDFDDQEPENGHLLRFEKKLDKAYSAPNSNWKRWSIAASIVTLIGLSLVLFITNSATETNSTAEHQDADFPLKEAQNFYQGEFNRQLAAISKTYQDAESRQMIKESQLLINELEKEYQTLESELENSGDYRVATAMILNYKSRISILESLIEQLKLVNELKHQQQAT